jgi:hypothetical protein
MFLACTKILGVKAAIDAGYGRDVEVVCEGLECMANLFGPMLRRIAADFRESAVDAGLLRAREMEADEAEEQGGWLPTTGMKSGVIEAGSPGEEFTSAMGLLDLSMEAFIRRT